MHIRVLPCSVAAPLPVLACMAVLQPHQMLGCPPSRAPMHPDLQSRMGSMRTHVDPTRGIQAQFREGLGSPELLVRAPDGALAPLSGPVPVPEVAAGSSHTVVVYMGVSRPGQLQLAAQLTCTLTSVRVH